MRRVRYSTSRPPLLRRLLTIERVLAGAAQVGCTVSVLGRFFVLGPRQRPHQRTNNAQTEKHHQKSAASHETNPHERQSALRPLPSSWTSAPVVNRVNRRIGYDPGQAFRKLPFMR